jgi:hypothetical protein
MNDNLLRVASAGRCFARRRLSERVAPLARVFALADQAVLEKFAKGREAV